MRAPADEPLAVLLLPGRLEGLELEAHARDLLSIPRVVALEPSRLRPRRLLRDAALLRQGRRLRFPGRAGDARGRDRLPAQWQGRVLGG